MRTKPKFHGIRDAEYPKEAKPLGLRGSVRLRVTIHPNGAIHAEILRSSGHEILDQAAIQYVYDNQQSFEPARENGTPVSASLPLTFNFRLR